jgi:hypothetical protein
MHVFARGGLLKPITLIFEEAPDDAACHLTRRLSCFGQTPILTAAKHGWHRIVKWLYEQYDLAYNNSGQLIEYFTESSVCAREKISSTYFIRRCMKNGRTFPGV